MSKTREVDRRDGRWRIEHVEELYKDNTIEILWYDVLSDTPGIERLQLDTIEEAEAALKELKARHGD